MELDITLYIEWLNIVLEYYFLFFGELGKFIGWMVGGIILFFLIIYPIILLGENAMNDGR